MMPQLLGKYWIAFSVVLNALLCYPAHAQDSRTQTIQLVFGIGDETRQSWDGSVSAMGGEIVEITGRFFDTEDALLENNGWRISSYVSPKTVYISQANPYSLDSVIKSVILKVRTSGSCRLRVQTAQGEFEVPLQDLELGKLKACLNGRATAALLPTPALLSKSGVEDDYPVVAFDRHFSPLVAWIGYTEGVGDTIFLSRYTGQGWSEPQALSERVGDYYHVRLATTSEGDTWAIWSAFENGNWDLYGRMSSGQSWSATQRLTDTQESDLLHQVATDNQGRLWLVWQSFGNGNGDIYLKSYQRGRWSDPIQITNTVANDWEPAVAADSNGRVYVAWDTYQHGDYDVYMRILDNGRLSDPMPVTDSVDFEGHVSLACDPRGRLWIAYENGGRDWGKDYPGEGGIPWGGWRDAFRGQQFGWFEGKGIHHGWLRKGLNQINKKVEVKVYENGVFWRPYEPVTTKFPEDITFSFEMPEIYAAPDGRIWLFFEHYRTLRRFSQDNTTFEYYCVYYDGRQWSEPFLLPRSTGNEDHRIAAAVDPQGNIWGTWPDSNQDRPQPGQDPRQIYRNHQNDVYVAVLTDVPKAGEEAIVHFLHTEIQQPRPVVESQVKKNRYTARVHNKAYKIYWGDLHRHTDISWDGFMDGTLLDMYRYAFDAAELDFIATTDHFFGDRPMTRENWKGYPWWRTQKYTDLFTVTAGFTGMFGYERSFGFPEGHRNIINLKRGYTYLPALREGNRISNDDEKYLWSTLRKEKQEAISIPHSSATGMGTDWTSNDPAFDTLVEIYQGCRNSYEYDGAPKSPPESELGENRKYEVGFVSNALEKGYRIGFIASSDHESTHISYAAVFAENQSRESIFSALKSRRTYAATDNIIVDYRLNGRMVGEEFESSETPEITARVIGTGEISEVAVIKNNKIVYTSDPEGAETLLTFRDSDAAKGWNYYYVRVRQKNEEMAWASPIWVNYKPVAR